MQTCDITADVLYSYIQPINKKIYQLDKIYM